MIDHKPVFACKPRANARLYAINRCQPRLVRMQPLALFPECFACRIR
ncbi:hypothetical protein DFR33_1212 [Bradymonas sediminis]|nr:hypothetical protein DFR33_1212 [Bradymonas sediminis]